MPCPCLMQPCLPHAAMPLPHAAMPAPACCALPAMSWPYLLCHATLPPPYPLCPATPLPPHHIVPWPHLHALPACCGRMHLAMLRPQQPEAAHKLEEGVGTDAIDLTMSDSGEKMPSADTIDLTMSDS